MLATYTNKKASELEFTYSRHGKPSLPLAEIDIRFSVSHSPNWR